MRAQQQLRGPGTSARTLASLRHHNIQSAAKGHAESTSAPPASGRQRGLAGMVQAPNLKRTQLPGALPAGRADGVQVEWLQLPGVGSLQ